MIEWASAEQYLQSCTSIKAKIAAIEAIQTALLTSAIKAAEKGAVSQYSLNDGQTIISCTYRNSKEIQASYMSYETLKNMLLSKLTGRIVRLVDGKNFTGNGF